MTENEPDYAEDFNPEFGQRWQAFSERLDDRAREKLTERGKLTNKQYLIHGSVESISIYHDGSVNVRYSHYGNWDDETFTREEFFTKAELRGGKINNLLE